MNKTTILAILVSLAISSAPRQADAQSALIGQSITRTAIFEYESRYQDFLREFEPDAFSTWHSKWLEDQTQSAQTSCYVALAEVGPTMWLTTAHGSFVAGRHQAMNAALTGIRTDLYLAGAYERAGNNTGNESYIQISENFHRSALKKVKSALQDANVTKEVSRMLLPMAGVEFIGPWTMPYYYIGQVQARMNHQSVCGLYNDVRLLAKVIAANPDFEFYETQIIAAYPMSYGE